MAIKTRQTNGTGVTNVNAPLSNSELDNNFIELVAEDAGKQNILAEGAFVDGDKTKLDADNVKLSGIASAATANPNALDNVVEDLTPELGGDLQSNGKKIVFAGSAQASSNNAKNDGTNVLEFNKTTLFDPPSIYGMSIPFFIFLLNRLVFLHPKPRDSNGALRGFATTIINSGDVIQFWIGGEEDESLDEKKVEITLGINYLYGQTNITGLGGLGHGSLIVNGDISMIGTPKGTVDGRNIAADGTKLDGIEASADVTDATNVAAAGALMDSEVTNLAQVKAFDSSDYATAAQGTTADAALPKAGGTMTGNIVLGDNVTTQFGAGTDLVIKHNGTHSQINNNTGSLQLNQFANDQDVVINSDDGSGSTANYFRADGSTGDAILYHYGSEKIKTQSGGVDVTGNITVSGTVDAGSVTSNIDINAQTGTTYTTVLADRSKLVTLDNASAITVTIPPNSSVAYPTGTKIDLLAKGAGQVTVAAGSGVTVNSAQSLKLRAQWSAASAIKLATDTWVLVGDLQAI